MSWLLFNEETAETIADGQPAWVVCDGVVQEQPWEWDVRHYGDAWLCPMGQAEPARILVGVTHYMPLEPPEGPK